MSYLRYSLRKSVVLSSVGIDSFLRMRYIAVSIVLTERRVIKAISFEFLSSATNAHKRNSKLFRSEAFCSRLLKKAG